MKSSSSKWWLCASSNTIHSVIKCTSVSSAWPHRWRVAGSGWSWFLVILLRYHANSDVCPPVWRLESRVLCEGVKSFSWSLFTYVAWGTAGLAILLHLRAQWWRILNWITGHTSSLRYRVFTGCLWKHELSSRSPSWYTPFFGNATRHISVTLWNLLKFNSQKSGRRQPRSSTTNAAVVLRTRTQFRKRVFFVCGPTIWNQISNISFHIRSVDLIYSYYFWNFRQWYVFVKL